MRGLLRCFLQSVVFFQADGARSIERLQTIRSQARLRELWRLFSALPWLGTAAPKKTLSLEEKGTLLKQMDSSSPLLRGVEIRYHFDLLRSLDSSREGVATARSDDLIKIMSPKPSTNLNQSLIPIPRIGAFRPTQDPIKETLEKIEKLKPTAQELAQYVDNPSYDVYEEAQRALAS